MLRAQIFTLSIVVAASGHGLPASLIPIGPFSGQFSEGWESFRPNEKGTSLSNPTLIMGGAAEISHPEMVIFEGPSCGLGSSGSAMPSDGVKALGVLGLAQTAAISFNISIRRFGSYWGAFTSPFDQDIGDPAVFTVGFYDSFDSLIGTETFSFSRTATADGLLEWHGWSSSVPIKRITFTEDQMALDGLQADPVPEPASTAIVALAALLFIKPRRMRQVRHQVASSS